LGTLDSQDYVDGLAKINVAEQTQLQQEKQYFAERDRLQLDWQNGAVAALNTYADQARNVSQQTQNMFTEAFNGITDALVKFVTTGKLSFGDLVNTIISDLVKLELQAAESTLFKTLFSSLGIAGSSGGAAALGSFSSGGYTGSMAANQIAGVVHGKEFVVPAEVVAKPGMLDFLQSMIGAPGYADGGYVGTPPVQSGSNSSNNGQTNLNVQIINNASDQVAISTKQTTDSAGNPTLEVMANLIEGQLAGKIAQGRGKLHDSISSKFGVRSRPGN
jgi:lambda family phage tail tape measure protein